MNGIFMNRSLAALAITALVVCLASSASAFPGGLGLIPSELVESVEVTTGGTEQKAKMGFWKTGPIGVLRVKTQVSESGRLELYAGSRGFVVNKTGAVYDLEGVTPDGTWYEVEVTEAGKVLEVDPTSIFFFKTREPGV